MTGKATPLGRREQGAQFFTLNPCRVYDTRWGAGPLAGGFDRWIPVGGYCGIPPDASAGSFNFTSISPSGNGLLSAYPCCAPRSNVVVGVKGGKNLAGFGVLGLGTGGQIGAYLDAPFSTTSDLAVDVSGYFRPPAPVQQWQEWEQVLLSPADYTTAGGDPYAEVELDIRFNNAATGISFVQFAFWDDDGAEPRAFRVITALPAGSWTWQVDRCTRNGASCLAGWSPSQGTIQVQSNTATGNPLYDRGFVQQVESVSGGLAVALSELQFPDGSAFTWVGDTAWTAPPREFDPPGSQAAHTAAWDAYLADRKAKGFTALQLAPAVTWQPRPGDTWRPLPAATGFSFTFVNNPQCSAASTPIPNKPCWQPVKTYWNHFKSMVRKANQAGMVVAVVGVMNPTGIAIAEAYPNSASARFFANYLAGRLGGLAVIYSPAFDDDPKTVDPGTGQPRRLLMNEVGRALGGTSPAGSKRTLTVHLSGSSSNCTDYQDFASDPDPWVTLHLFQGGHGGQGGAGPCAASGTNDVQNAMERARVMPTTLTGYTPALPAINSEGPYDASDYSTPHPNVDTRYRLRQACYVTALSNAVGCPYGAVGLSLWDQPGGSFPNEPSRYFGLDSARDMTHLKANLLGRKLVSRPDWIKNNPAGQKYKMVLASDGPLFVLAYLPGEEPTDQTGSSTEIRIDATKLPCAVCPSQNGTPWSFTWVNPTTNAQAPSGPNGGSCNNLTSGQLTFVRPSCPGGANCDWLLRLEKTGTGGCPSAVASDAPGAKTSSKTLAAGPVAVEVWTDTSSGDGTAALYAAPWDDSGRQEPILVAPAGKAFQTAPRVDRLGDQHLVVWQADRLDGSLYGIYGALLGPRGEVSGPFQVSHYTEHDQREPAVAAGPRDEALVVWSSYGQDGDQGGIFGRLVREGASSADPLQAPLLGEEVGGSGEREGHQRNPQVVADEAGFWVAWETVDGNGLSSSLSLRRLGLNGRPEAAEARLPAAAGEQRRLVALESPEPGSVVVRWWEQDAQGRIFQSRRQPVGPRGVLGPVIPEGEQE